MTAINEPVREIHQGSHHFDQVDVDDLRINREMIFGDASTDTLILKGRVSTLTEAGGQVEFGAAYVYGEAIELRYEVDSWDGIGSQFNGMFLRVRPGIASSGKALRGAEIVAETNNLTTGDLKGVFGTAYVRGTSAKTLGPAYGGHFELSFDASSSTNTITTEAAALLAKISGGVVDAYTKLHGVIIRVFDMDGQSRTYGNAISIEDGSEAGVITWTSILNITNPASYFLALATGAGGVDTTIAGQVVGTINSVLKCKFGSTDFYLYGYAGKPTA